MAKLEDLTRGAAVKGILPDCLVTVIDVKWYGSAAVEFTYKDPAGTSTTGRGAARRGGETGNCTGVGHAKPKVPVLRRFHGSAKIDATRLSPDVELIASSVVQHLAGRLDAEVSMTVEIEAEIPSGAPDNVVRTVTENCRTLKFESSGFEQSW